MFLKASTMERAIFLEMKEKCKMSLVKLIVWSIVVKLWLVVKSTKILFLYIFEYGVECGAESGVN